MKTVHVTNRLINRDSLSVGCLEPFSMCREGVGPPSTREQLVVRLVSFVLISFLLLPLTASGVVPAPDGGYPGGNTAEGQAALLNLTTGGFNTAIGWLSLRTNSTGQFNTAIGAGTLLANTRDENTAAGGGALLGNTTGFANTADGVLALFSNTIGNGNTAIGVEALRLNDIGSGHPRVW